MSDQPIFVGYYTPDPPIYAEHAEGLKESLDAFGLLYDIRRVTVEGDWCMRIAYKIPFLRRMADLYPGEKLVYCDVDARIRQYPDWLVDFSADLGVHKWRWPGGHAEYLAGTIVFRANTKMRAFLGEWEILHDQALRRRSGEEFKNWPEFTLEQMIMAYRKKEVFHFEEMPAEYCLVTDREGCGPPVIEHLMANRQTKRALNKAWERRGQVVQNPVDKL